MDNVVLNKTMVIRRCLARINEVYDGNYENLHDYTKQDSIVLNIQRACEAAIDLAMHIVAREKLGLPQRSREAFDLLSVEGILKEGLAHKMQAMVGFRNIAVHDYQALNLDIVRSIIETHLGDFNDFTESILEWSAK